MLSAPCTWTPTSEASSSQLPSRCSRLLTVGRHGDSDVTATSTFVIHMLAEVDDVATSLTPAPRAEASLANQTQPFFHCSGNHHKQNRFTALFQDHPGEPVPEENFWTLWCKERLTKADTQTSRLGATPSRLTSAHLHHPPIFSERSRSLYAVACPSVVCLSVICL